MSTDGGEGLFFILSPHAGLCEWGGGGGEGLHLKGTHGDENVLVIVLIES